MENMKKKRIIQCIGTKKTFHFTYMHLLEAYDNIKTWFFLALFTGLRFDTFKLKPFDAICDRKIMFLMHKSDIKL